MKTFKSYILEDATTPKAAADKTSFDRTREKHGREKDDLGSRQDIEKQKAREDDFKKRTQDREREKIKNDAKKRSRMNEYLEDGTDELVASYKNVVPAQEGTDPCWDDHEAIGTKEKNGRTVPNCVPKTK